MFFHGSEERIMIFENSKNKGNTRDVRGNFYSFKKIV